MKLYTLEVFSCYTGYEHLISKLPAIFNYLLHKGRTNAGMLYIGTQIYGGFESFGVCCSFFPLMYVGIPYHFPFCLVDVVREVVGYFLDALLHLYGRKFDSFERNCRFCYITIIYSNDVCSIVRFNFSNH